MGMIGRKHSQATLDRFRARCEAESEAADLRRYRKTKPVPMTTLELTPDEQDRYLTLRIRKVREAEQQRPKRYEFLKYAAAMRGCMIVYSQVAQ